MPTGRRYPDDVRRRAVDEPRYRQEHMRLDAVRERLHLEAQHLHGLGPGDRGLGLGASSPASHGVRLTGIR